MDVYKDCLRSCNIPGGSKDVQVVFIPKVSKANHVGPKNYRPISLSSFQLNALESRRENRLRALFIKRQVFLRQI